MTKEKAAELLKAITPGPWAKKRSLGLKSFFIEATGLPDIVDVWDCDVGETQAAANAEAIALVPELLASMVRLYGYEDPMRQSCKHCGRRDGINFAVSDEDWLAIVPKEYEFKVLCPMCFDKFAVAANREYSIKSVAFAGEKGSFFRAALASGDAPPTRNSEVLASFVEYCRTHPLERFWQALRNWSEYPFIISRSDRDRDTFYLEGRRHEAGAQEGATPPVLQHRTSQTVQAESEYLPCWFCNEVHTPECPRPEKPPADTPSSTALTNLYPKLKPETIARIESRSPMALHAEDDLPGPPVRVQGSAPDLAHEIHEVIMVLSGPVTAKTAAEAIRLLGELKPKVALETRSLREQLAAEKAKVQEFIRALNRSRELLGEAGTALSAKESELAQRDADDKRAQDHVNEIIGKYENDLAELQAKYDALKKWSEE